tara:strand:- start:15050 stop:20680 length:5631 start_codon:yes stop_codon:yes gene_type:complete
MENLSNEFSLQILKSLIDIKNKTYKQIHINGFNTSKNSIQENQELIKVVLKDEEKQKKFIDLLNDAQPTYETGKTLGNLSNLLDFVASILVVKFQGIPKDELQELTGTKTGGYKTLQQGDCRENSEMGKLITEYNNTTSKDIAGISIGEDYKYDDVREIILDNKIITNLEKIRKQITLLFSQDTIFKKWIQETFTKKNGEITDKDINCLQQRKSYIYLIFLFLVAYENSPGKNVEPIPLGKIMEVNNNTSNYGKLQLLKENRPKFSLDVRQSLAVQRFTKFNRDKNGEIIDKACFLFHGVGTGKTLTSLSIALTHLKKKHSEEDGDGEPKSPLKILLIAPEGLFRAAFLGDDAKLIGIHVHSIESEYVKPLNKGGRETEYIEKAKGEVLIIPESIPSNNDTEKPDDYSERKNEKYFIEFIGYNYNALCSENGGLERISEYIDNETILICDEAHRLVLPDKGLKSLKPYNGTDFTKMYKDGTHASYITMHTPERIRLTRDQEKSISIATMSTKEPKNIIRQYAFLKFCMQMSQCIFLTGTPIQYDANDLIDIINFLNAREVGGDTDVNLRLNQSNHENFLKEKTDFGNDNDERIFKPFVGSQSIGDTIVDIVLTVDNFSEYLNGLWNGKVNSVDISNATHRTALGCLNVISGTLDVISDIRNKGGLLNALVPTFFNLQKGGSIKEASIALKEAIKNFNTIDDRKYISTLKDRPATLEGYLTYLIENKKEVIFKDKLNAIFIAFETYVDSDPKIIKKDELKRKLQKVPVMFEKYITESKKYFQKLKEGYSDDGIRLFSLSNNLEKSIKNFYNSIIVCVIHDLTTFNSKGKTKEEKKYALFQMINIKRFINDWYTEHVLNDFKIVINFTHLNLFQSELQKPIEKAESIPGKVSVKNDATKSKNDDITIYIRNIFRNETVIISRNATVKELKTKMGIDPKTELRFVGTNLDDTRTLSSYKIQDGSTIDQMQILPKTGNNQYRSSMINAPFQMTTMGVRGGSKLGKRTVGGMTVIECREGVDFVVEYLRKIGKITKCMLDDVKKNLFKIGMPNGIQEQILYFSIMNSGLVFNFIFGKNLEERKNAYSNLNSFGLLTSTKPSVLGETIKTFYENGMIQSIEELASLSKTASMNIIKALAKYYFGDITSLFLTIGPTITNALISVYKQLNEYNVNKLIEHSKNYISIYNYDFEIKGIKKFLYEKNLPKDEDIPEPFNTDGMFDTEGNTNHFPNKFVTNIIVPYTSEQIQQVYMKTESKESIQKAQLLQLNSDDCPSITEKDMTEWRRSLQKVKPEVISECGCGIYEEPPTNSDVPPNFDFNAHTNKDDQLIHIPKNFSIRFLNGLEIRLLDEIQKEVSAIYSTIHQIQSNTDVGSYYKDRQVGGLIENIHNNLPKDGNNIQNNFIKNIIENTEKRAKMRFEIILHIMKLTRCGVIFKRGELHLHPHYYINKSGDTTYQYFLPVFYPTTKDIMNSFIQFLKKENYNYVHMTGEADALNNKFNIGSKMTFPIASYSETNNNPICVIIKPEHTEGYSFIYNPILCCPALCKTSGDTEQVYGRILRKYNERNKKLILNTVTNGYKFDKHIYQFFGGKREDQKNIETIHRAYFPQGEKNISSCGELEFFSEFMKKHRNSILEEALDMFIDLFEQQEEKVAVIDLNETAKKIAEEVENEERTTLSSRFITATTSMLKSTKSSLEDKQKFLNENVRKYWQSWTFSDLLPLSFKMNPQLDAMVKAYLSFIVTRDGEKDDEVKQQQDELRQKIISEGQNFPLSPFVSEEGQLKQLANVTNISENYFNRLVKMGEIPKEDKIQPFDITLINKKNNKVNCKEPSSSLINTFLCLTEIASIGQLSNLTRNNGGRKTKRNRKKRNIRKTKRRRGKK